MKTDHEINICFTNDIHSYIPKSIALFNELVRIKKSSNTLFIDLGDFSEGAAFYNLFKGKPESELITKLYNFIIPGNHGFQDIVKLYKEGFPVINSNLLYKNKLFFKKNILYQSQSHNIAFLSIISPEAFYSIEVKKRKGFMALDPHKVLPNLISELRQTGHKIILLSHSGFDYDVELAKKIPDIDVIISSHCHSKFYKRRVDNTLITKAPEHGGGYGKLRLKNNHFASRLISVKGVTDYLSPEIRFMKGYID